MKNKEVALQILCALLSNPERYTYISKLVLKGLSQEEATMKNVNKAIKIAESFNSLYKEDVPKPRRKFSFFRKN